LWSTAHRQNFEKGLVPRSSGVVPNILPNSTVQFLGTYVSRG
jgi:hypothetical protein